MGCYMEVVLKNVITFRWNAIKSIILEAEINIYIWNKTQALSQNVSRAHSANEKFFFLQIIFTLLSVAIFSTSASGVYFWLLYDEGPFVFVYILYNIYTGIYAKKRIASSSFPAVCMCMFMFLCVDVRCQFRLYNRFPIDLIIPKNDSEPNFSKYIFLK